jgi:hypothetical protein
MDIPAEHSGRVSRWRTRYGPDVLRHSSRVLLIDFERSDLHIDQRRLDLRVSHQLHQGRHLFWAKPPLTGMPKQKVSSFARSPTSHGSFPDLHHHLGKATVRGRMPEQRVTSMLYVQLAPKDVWSEYTRAIEKRTHPHPSPIVRAPDIASNRSWKRIFRLSPLPCVPIP